MTLPQLKAISKPCSRSRSSAVLLNSLYFFNLNLVRAGPEPPYDYFVHLLHALMEMPILHSKASKLR
jgi:hypothetical protein